MGALFDKIKGMETVNQESFAKALNETAYNRRVLTDFILELTPACNFSCKMCYAHLTPEEISAQGRSVLSFDEWKYYIDGFVGMNALFCTLTGGECTIHPDFCRIYKYIYNKGITISVMTNGSNITDEILEMFKQMPPNKLMITVYGTSAETYGRMCSNAPAFEKVRKNIESLREAGIEVIAQFTATKDNLADMEGVYDYTSKLGIEMRYTNLLTSFDQCSTDKMESNEADEEEFVRIHQRIWCRKNNRPLSYIEEQDIEMTTRLSVCMNNEIIEKGMPCNAGRTSCYINWKGEMQPCTMIDCFSKDPHSSSVEECWKEVIAWADNVPRITECQNCLHRTKCKTCTALHYNDTGVFGKPSPRLCWKIKNPEKAAKIEKQYANLLNKKEK